MAAHVHVLEPLVTGALELVHLLLTFAQVALVLLNTYPKRPHAANDTFFLQLRLVRGHHRGGVSRGRPTYTFHIND